MKTKHIIGFISAIVCLIAASSCNEDVDYQIFDQPIVTQITTGAAQVTATTATIEGYVANLSEQASNAYTVGVVYSLSESSVENGTRVAGSLNKEDGTVTANLKGLSTGVTYYYAIFVTLQSRVSYYGEVKSFVTTDAAIATADAASVTSVSASLGATLNGVQDKLDTGTCAHGIAISSNPDLSQFVKISDNGTSNSYNVIAEALVPMTTYYYTAYMVINDKDVFGPIKQFTTNASKISVEGTDADYVNMGTSKDWAKYNIGSDNELSAGGLYGFGDIAGLARSTANSDYALGDIQATQYDMATAAAMGMIPSSADWEELIAVCDIISTEVNGVEGVNFTSRINGNSIFFPNTSYRIGENVAESTINLYRTADTDPKSADYAYAYQLGNGNASKLSTEKSTGIAIRTVRNPYVQNATVDNSKVTFSIVQGDGIISLYDAAANENAVNPAQIDFTSNMAVSFALTGISGNIKENATLRPQLIYITDGYEYNGEFVQLGTSCNADGNFTVYCQPGKRCISAKRLAVIIPGLEEAINEDNAVQVSVESLEFDLDPMPIKELSLTNNEASFYNKDGDETNGRFDLYNNWGGATGTFSNTTFNDGNITLEFTISGIDGNLKADATKDYVATFSFVCEGWYPSFWGMPTDPGAVRISQDGTYTIQAYVWGGSGDFMFIGGEIYGLWKDLENPDGIKVTVNHIWGHFN